MNTCQQLLDSCTKESKLLLKLAENNEWDTLEIALQKRSKSMEKLFQLEIAAKDAALVRQAIEAIKLIDQKTMSLASKNKEDIFKALKYENYKHAEDYKLWTDIALNRYKMSLDMLQVKHLN